MIGSAQRPVEPVPRDEGPRGRCRMDGEAATRPMAIATRFRSQEGTAPNIDSRIRAGPAPKSERPGFPGRPP